MGKKKGKDKTQLKAQKAERATAKAERRTQKQISRKQKQNDSDSDAEEDIEKLIARFAREQRKLAANEVTRTPIDPKSWEARCYSQMLAISNHGLYILGGERFDGRRIICFGDQICINTTETKDLPRNKFSEIRAPVVPTPRSSHQLVAHNGTAYLFGGEYTSPNESQFYHYRDFWSLNMHNLQWTAQTESGKLPPARSGHRMCSLPQINALALFGGFSDTGATAKYFDDLWIYLVQQNRWLKLDKTLQAQWPEPRSGFNMWRSEQQEKRVFIYGGYSRKAIKGSKKYIPTVHQDLWSVSIDSDYKAKWEKHRVRKSEAPCARCNMASVELPGSKHVLFYGGIVDPRDFPDNNAFANDKINKKKKKKQRENLESDSSNEDNDEYGNIPMIMNDFWLLDTQSLLWHRVDAPKSLFLPFGRYSAQMITATNDNNESPNISAETVSVHMYGGCYDVGERQYTLNDLWQFQLSIMERRIVDAEAIVALDREQIEGGWQTSDDDDDEDDDHGDDDDEDDNEDDDDNEEDDDDGDDDDEDDANTEEKIEAKEEETNLDRDTEASRKEALERAHRGLQTAASTTKLEDVPDSTEPALLFEMATPKAEEPLAAFFERTQSFWLPFAQKSKAPMFFDHESDSDDDDDSGSDSQTSSEEISDSELLECVSRPQLQLKLAGSVRRSSRSLRRHAFWLAKERFAELSDHLDVVREAQAAIKRAERREAKLVSKLRRLKLTKRERFRLPDF